MRTIALWLWIVGTAGVLRAQIPDEFENLRVLPPDVEPGELIETMRRFSFSLGVRCEFVTWAEEEARCPTWSSRRTTRRRSARRDA